LIQIVTKKIPRRQAKPHLPFRFPALEVVFYK
jgi:hypothetical protein